MKQFSSKNKEITNNLQGVHFSSFDLIDKLIQDFNNATSPIIAKVPKSSTNPGQTQVKVNVYPLHNHAGGKYMIIYIGRSTGIQRPPSTEHQIQMMYFHHGQLHWSSQSNF